MNSATRIRTREKTDCYFCGTEGHPLYEGLTDNLYGVPGEWSYRQCANLSCGLIWLDPAPVPADLDAVYETYYTHADQAGSSSGARGPALAGLLALAMNLVKQGRLMRHRRLTHQLFDSLELGERVLEVGSGKGEFLQHLQRSGRQVWGVDPDRQACDHARDAFGLDVFPGTLEQAAFDNSTFDAVMMNHVIEHVPDPLAMLRECRRVLRPGGRLALITPNHASLGHSVFREHWLGLDPPRHLHLFAGNTLADLVKRAGFEDADVSGLTGGAFFIFRESWQIANRKQPHGYGRNQARVLKALQVSLLKHYATMAARQDATVGEELVAQCRKPAI